MALSARTRPVVLALAVLALVASGNVTAPARAAEVATRPADGVFDLEGRGYGHGRGLSQWGAYGAADAGVAWTSILAFYYPGTARTALPDSRIRVQISADAGTDVRVDPAPGLTLVSGTQRAALPTGAGFEGWRLVRSGAGLALQRLAAGVWHPHASPVALVAGAGFTTASDSTRLVLPSGNRMALRGTVTAVPGAGSALHTVAALPMNAYLRGVVPAEMPASWHLEALRAQSVAARTYAARLRAGAGGRLWDTCDTTACQVFKGTATYSSSGTLLVQNEHPRTDQAIAETGSTVLTYGGALILAEFSAANGGWTAAGPLPYQVAKPDPYDGRLPSNAHSWRTTLAATTIERTYPEVGSLQSVAVTSRTGQGELGGRVLTATLRGSAGSRTLSGDQFRSAFALRSNWFRFLGTNGFSRDMDADGEADVMAIDAGGTLRLYPGADGRAFGQPVVAGTGWNGLPLVLHAGDWSGDGRPDVVGRSASGTLHLYGSQADGTLRGLGQIGNGWNGMRTLVGPGDWDGDGRADLLSVVAADGSLRLYRGDGASGFAGWSRIGSGWSGTRHVTAVGDVTADGTTDLVAVRESTSDLVIYPGDGRGGFGAAVVLGRGWNAFDALIGPGDWDGDGRADLLARRADGSLWCYPGTGSGFGPPTQVGHGWSGLRVLS